MTPQQRFEKAREAFNAAIAGLSKARREYVEAVQALRDTEPPAEVLKEGV